MLVIWSFCFVCDCSQGFSERMRRRDQVDLHPFDPDPERTLHRTRREQRTDYTEHAENREQNKLEI